MKKEFDFTTMELLMQKLENDNNPELKKVVNDLILGSKKAGTIGLDMKEVASICTLGWVVSQQPELESLMEFLLSKTVPKDEFLN